MCQYLWYVFGDLLVRGPGVEARLVGTEHLPDFLVLVNGAELPMVVVQIFAVIFDVD